MEQTQSELVASANGYRANANVVRQALLDRDLSLVQMRVVQGILLKSLDLGRGRACFHCQQMLADFIGVARQRVTEAMYGYDSKGSPVEGLVDLKVVMQNGPLYMVLLPTERWRAGWRNERGQEWEVLSNWLSELDPDAAYDGRMPVALRDLYGAGDELNEQLRGLDLPRAGNLSGNESRQGGGGNEFAPTGPVGGSGLADGERDESVRPAGPSISPCTESVHQCTDSVPSGDLSAFPCTDSVRDGGVGGAVSQYKDVSQYKLKTFNVEAFQEGTPRESTGGCTESVHESETGNASTRNATCAGFETKFVIEELAGFFGGLRLFPPMRPGQRCTIQGAHTHCDEMASSGGMWRKCAREMEGELSEGFATMKSRLATGHNVRHPAAWMVSWLSRNYPQAWSRVRVT